MSDENPYAEFRPYDNEHSCRLNNPKKYKDFARVNCDQKHEGKCIDVVYGILGPKKSEIQALRFKTKIWTESAARTVCKERKGTFEPAKKSKSSSENKVERRFVKAVELRIEKRDDAPSKLIGYAAVFNKLSEKLLFFREKIAPGAFKKSLKSGDDVRALFNHDPNHVLGRSTSGTLNLKEDKKGLLSEINLPDTQLGRDLETLVDRGDITGMSFGFITVRDEWEHNEGEEDIRILKEVKLIDVSPVTYPAYPDTSVAVRSHELWKQEKEVVEESGGRDAMHMRLRLAEI